MGITTELTEIDPVGFDEDVLEGQVLVGGVVGHVCGESQQDYYSKCCGVKMFIISVLEKTKTW